METPGVERPGDVEVPLRLRGDGLVGKGDDSVLILGLREEEEEEAEEAGVTEDFPERLLLPLPLLPLLLLLPLPLLLLPERAEEEPC